MSKNIVLHLRFIAKNAFFKGAPSHVFNVDGADGTQLTLTPWDQIVFWCRSGSDVTIAPAIKTDAKDEARSV